MTEKTKIYILGRTDIDKDEDEAIRDIGAGVFASTKQLVTAAGVAGVAQAAAWGFNQAGGATEYIELGQIPDSRNVFIFADPEFRERVESRVPDWEKREWMILMGPAGVFEFHSAMLRVLSMKNIALPKYGGGK